MAIYVDVLPHLKAINKKVALPREGRSTDTDTSHLGFGSLVFLFSNTIEESVRTMTNSQTLIRDGKYNRYYYNLLYKGRIIRNYNKL